MSQWSKTREMVWACSHTGETVGPPDAQYPANGRSPLKCLPCVWAERGSPQWRDARYGEKETET